MKRGTILVFCLLALGFGASLVYVPRWQINGSGVEEQKERVKLENELRGSLAQIYGIAFILVGLYFVIRRMKASDSVAELSREGQINERFTRAINQLGASRSNGEKRLEIRLGGVFALEGIAKISSEYYWPVIEILTAYVRENAPWRGNLEEPVEKLRLVGGAANSHDQDIIPTKIPADIQAVLTVLGRRKHLYLKGEDHRLDLSRTNLSGASIANANFKGAFMHRANLKHAMLIKSDISSAYLDDCWMTKAQMPYADLEGSSLRAANLQGANLMATKLHQTKLTKANLEEADLRGADLREADLREANLQKANLQKAKLRGANLRGAKLLGAVLEGADLEAADLRVSDLREANMKGANLWRAAVQGANLVGSNLSGASLRNADLRLVDFRDALLEGANLEGANLEKANLQRTHLEKAILRKVKGIPVDRLVEAGSLYATKMDSELKKRIKNEYPHLLQK
jgi:uncharacterized protein YjbI with pentapeptide repeats